MSTTKCGLLTDFYGVCYTSLYRIPISKQHPFRTWGYLIVIRVDVFVSDGTLGMYQSEDPYCCTVRTDSTAHFITYFAPCSDWMGKGDANKVNAQ